MKEFSRCNRNLRPRISFTKGLRLTVVTLRRKGRVFWGQGSNLPVCLRVGPRALFLSYAVALAWTGRTGGQQVHAIECHSVENPMTVGAFVKEDCAHCHGILWTCPLLDGPILGRKALCNSGAP